jgi:hypothetical protein
VGPVVPIDRWSPEQVTNGATIITVGAGMEVPLREGGPACGDVVVEDGVKAEPELSSDAW